MTRLETKRLLINLFREETLPLTGLCAVYDVPSDFISKVMKSLSLLLRRELRKLDQRDNPITGFSISRRSGPPHPAILEFLVDLERQFDELGMGLRQPYSTEEAQTSDKFYAARKRRQRSEKAIRTRWLREK